ncbi:3-oxoacyl-ACP synthase III [Verrucomicrobia bacterium]|nr:3-oxoacyl-ACP synthase III [Verrucomicrobiota bacterium]
MPSYSKVFISSLAYELAPVVVSSEELEERLGPMYRKFHFSEGQLEELTGIYERRWWEPSTRLSDPAIEAVKKAVAKAGVPSEAIGALAYTGVCREQFEPATACRIADGVGVAPDAAVYDISNACLGVLNGFFDIANRIELGQIRAGVVVSCESAREINDIMIDRMNQEGSMELFTKALATLTGGSGAVAVVLTDGSFGEEQHRLLGGVTQTAPEFHDLCRWGWKESDARPTEYMSTDSVGVLKNGVALGMRTWNAFLKEMDWTADSVDRVICHQVGSEHQKQILKLIGVSEGKDYVTYPFLGNIGTVSLPITAALADERGVLKKGDKVGFLGIGSGLNCLMVGVEW